jgi:hypothetical protein
MADLTAKSRLAQTVSEWADCRNQAEKIREQGGCTAGEWEVFAKASADKKLEFEKPKKR